MPMRLVSTHQARASINIKATVHNLGDMASEILPAHALTGCDQVPMCYGIGKGKMMKTIKAGRCSLGLLGDLSANIQHVIS